MPCKKAIERPTVRAAQIHPGSPEEALPERPTGVRIAKVKLADYFIGVEASRIEPCRRESLEFGFPSHSPQSSRTTHARQRSLVCPAEVLIVSSAQRTAAEDRSLRRT